jgi:hypothetical protein
MTIYKDVDYATLRRQAQIKLEKKIKAGEFNSDLSTQTMNRVFQLSAVLAIGVLTLRTVPHFDEIKKETIEGIENISIQASETMKQLQGVFEDYQKTSQGDVILPPVGGKPQNPQP